MEPERRARRACRTSRPVLTCPAYLCWDLGWVQAVAPVVQLLHLPPCLSPQAAAVGTGPAVGLAVTGHEQRPGWAWWPPHRTLGCFHFHLLLGGGWAIIPTVGLHWYRTSRRCASSPQTPHPPPPAITRPLASTQLVIHLSPQRAAPGPAPHQPQRGFPRSRPPPPDATDTHAGSASGHAAAGPRTLMHCTSRRISSLGQVGEPRLIML